MASCEKCWRDAGGNADRYEALLKARGGSNECTPEQQAGPDAAECSKCRRVAVHQHTRKCMACDEIDLRLKNKIPPSECPTCGGDRFDIVTGIVEIAGKKYRPPSHWTCDDCLWNELSMAEIKNYPIKENDMSEGEQFQASDQRGVETQRKSAQVAIARIMSARRAIVDVRFPRKVEDEMLRLTSEMLDQLEEHQKSLVQTEDEK